jgi:hypothetical protein
MPPTVGQTGTYVYPIVTDPIAEESLVVSRLPLGALADAAAVALIVTEIEDRPDDAVKNPREAGSVKSEVPESVIERGGNATVSVVDPKGPADMGELVRVWVDCEMGWLRPSISKLPDRLAVMTVGDVGLRFCDVMLLWMLAECFTSTD